MRRFLISELDPQACALAKAYGMGVETIAFCAAENMEDEDLIAKMRAELDGFASLSLHAPYYELTPCAIDPMIGQVSLHRYRQAAQLCARMGIPRMVVHSGFQAQTYYPEWFVPKSVEFWRGFVRELPAGVEIALENVFDPVPEHLIEIVDSVQDARLGICLDVGHAQAYSDVPPEKWIRAMGARITHVHLHNNSGLRDEHAPLDCGRMDMAQVLACLDEAASRADIAIESVDAAACICYLLERGYLNEKSV